MIIMMKIIIVQCETAMNSFPIDMSALMMKINVDNIMRTIVIEVEKSMDGFEMREH